MKSIAFISGKGGTGKTSLVASFAKLASPVIVADCDVDAANAALLMPGETLHSEPFWAGSRAEIDRSLCITCGECADACRFHAIGLHEGWFVVDPLSCEGCGVCHFVCPADAVRMSPNQAGNVEVSKTAVGMLVRGALLPGQGNSGKLVARVRELSKERAEEGSFSLVLIDGPPGIGCPVHATLTGVDLSVVVTEPTPSGEHDLERALELLRRFEVPGAIVINKADLSSKMSESIEVMAKERGVPIIGKIPFERLAPRSLAQRRAPIEIERLQPILAQIWVRIIAMARGEALEGHREGDAAAALFGES
jgi:MinD superfamily P-loop ATPase